MNDDDLCISIYLSICSFSSPSGGEPLLQIDGVTTLLKMLKVTGIHTLIETAGGVRWSSFVNVFPYVSEWYFDIKCGDVQVLAEDGDEGGRIGRMRKGEQVVRKDWISFAMANIIANVLFLKKVDF